MNKCDSLETTIDDINYKLILSNEKSQNLESTVNVVKSELTHYIKQELKYKDKICNLRNINQDLSYQVTHLNESMCK